MCEFCDSHNVTKSAWERIQDLARLGAKYKAGLLTELPMDLSKVQLRKIEPHFSFDDMGHCEEDE